MEVEAYVGVSGTRGRLCEGYRSGKLLKSNTFRVAYSIPIWLSRVLPK